MSKTADALKMTKGSGDNAFTSYNCSVIERAREQGVSILIVRKNKRTGKKEMVKADPRQVHRSDPLAVYSDSHEYAGYGKYIDLEAFEGSTRDTVRGAQHCNPHLREDGSYHTIIETLKDNIGVRKLAQLTASVVHDDALGTHLIWRGKRDSDGCLLASEWFTEDELWDAAVEFSTDLKNLWRKRNTRAGKTAYNKAKAKFITNLGVLRRATCVVDVGTGERDEECGGATPCGKPLEQFGFAIDRRFLTYGLDSEGTELARHYYRLVIGRPEPHILPRKSWAMEDATSDVAYLSPSVRRKCRSAT